MGTSPDQPSPLERGVTKTVFLGCRIAARTAYNFGRCLLQRLFSTFPDGWPGAGLLLLRLSAIIPLMSFCIAALSGETLGDPIAVTQDLVAAFAGILLLGGLWTPASGVGIAVDELWIASSRYSLQPGDLWTHVLLAVLGAGLAMLGPGAWSVDAHLYGRKRFNARDRTRGT
jgi:putative oxidoreductase